MGFQIISGTAIQEFVEQCGSAADALGRVRVLLKAGSPNIRVLDEVGRSYSFTEIDELAGWPMTVASGRYLKRRKLCRWDVLALVRDTLENQTRHQ
jgi:hypothetical protein